MTATYPQYKQEIGEMLQGVYQHEIIIIIIIIYVTNIINSTAFTIKCHHSLQNSINLNNQQVRESRSSEQQKILIT